MYATLAEMLGESAKRFADKTCVVTPDRTISFEQLDQFSSALVPHLSSLGVKPGDAVTLWLPNGWRWMVAYYAILRLGAVVNPCNILLTVEEVAFMAGDCHARAIITSREKAASLRERLSLPILIDTSDDARAVNASLTLDEVLSGPVSHATHAQLPPPDPRSTATIAYTSGTTGHPKGAVLRHSTLMLNTSMMALMHGRTQNDVVVSALPCTHVYGNVVMNAAVMSGMTLVLLPRFEEAEVLKAIQSHRATLFEGVPTMYMRLLSFPELDRYTLSSLRMCTVGGQTMPLAKMEETERLFGCPLVELWGMTELGGLGITHPHNVPRRLGSIGVPCPLIEARVVAAGAGGAELPRGDVGELVVRGPLVMQGYYGNEDATRAAIDPEGWLHTGDLVRQDADGYVYVVDRAKEVIISGGYNVYPAEVERIIAQHPAVAMVAVAAMRDELKGQAPKAFVVCRPGMSCEASEIIAHCREHLAAYKLPRDVAFLDDLPKTSTGKILRRALATATI